MALDDHRLNWVSGEKNRSVTNEKDGRSIDPSMREGDTVWLHLDKSTLVFEGWAPGDCGMETLL